VIRAGAYPCLKNVSVVDSLLADSLVAAGGLARGFGGDGSGGGAYGEPLGGAGDSAQDTSPFGSLDSGVSFFG
jgi:hypothetical protein